MSFLSTLRALLTLGKGVIKGLPEAAADRDPLDLFGAWFDAARRAGLLLPEAMTLATCTRDGRPSARLVLLKGFDERGFVFYTNFESRKAKELAENPHAALAFHWPVLQRQVRVQGSVTRLSEEESRAYFRTRARGSCIGAWASKQSMILEDRRQLEAQFRAYKQQFKGEEVPLPPFWGGFRVAAQRIEFWQGRANRLHDRLCFVREGDGWTSMWLYP
ncbi:MAG: pyridoxamine 5'-phosphate oxidase [Rhodothermales bacterium]